jgi:hypothetical protein
MYASPDAAKTNSKLLCQCLVHGPEQCTGQKMWLRCKGSTFTSCLKLKRKASQWTYILFKIPEFKFQIPPFSAMVFPIHSNPCCIGFENLVSEFTRDCLSECNREQQITNVLNAGSYISSNHIPRDGGFDIPYKFLKSQCDYKTNESRKTSWNLKDECTATSHTLSLSGEAPDFIILMYLKLL